MKSFTKQFGPVTSVIGAQWGDEGKGKVVDLLAKEYDIIARACGGANAGHTIVVGDHKQIAMVDELAGHGLGARSDVEED